MSDKPSPLDKQISDLVRIMQGNTFTPLPTAETITGTTAGVYTEPEAWAEGLMLGLQTPSEGVRFIRASQIESVSSHKDGSIIKTKSGDFHVVKALPEEICGVMVNIERS